MKILDLAKTSAEMSSLDEADFSEGFPDGTRMSAGDFNLALKTWDEPRVRFLAGQGFAHWNYFTSSLPISDTMPWALDHVVSKHPGTAYLIDRADTYGLTNDFRFDINNVGGSITGHYEFDSKMISGELYDGTWLIADRVGSIEGMSVGVESFSLFDATITRDQFVPEVKMPCPVRGSLGYLYVKYDTSGPDGYYFFTATAPGVNEQKLAFLCATDDELVDGGFAYVRNLGMYFGLWDGSVATLAFSSRGYKVGYTTTPWIGRPQLQAFHDKLLVFVKTSTPVGYNAFDLIEVTNRDPSSWRVIRSFWQSTADSPLHTCELVRSDRDDICCVIHDGVLYWTVDLENWDSMVLYSRVKTYVSKIAGPRMFLMPTGDTELSDLNIWASGVIGDVP